ncbi:adenylate kinase family protein [Candidatus Riesia pediculicola]|uniref:Adenylate kinase n=1 Tax=Riesia pediculicola (strain USDA) TaxID=515618 RepID=D4G899_RIEPU|nr:nucleoside monophosphate kinase [Candidatus Riesia pediculicola]ADD79562.1 adenylate kinase [Candidatus Riesia pediculicola USDA]ARC53794.1 hypothetical protein AOE55_01355 [Candidatus Riesia pediculicola]QOJ86429.1 nucleoside monophosphate kinase [Candidatus Riesia pediculicola]
MIGIILIGSPGSGKGTHCEFISKKYNIQKISVGNLLRNQTPLDQFSKKEISRRIDQGQLIPDEIVIDLMRKKISEINYSNGFLLDGFPRNIRQAQEMTKLIDARYVLIELSINLTNILDRISGRLIHFPSNRTYHIKFCPPKKKGIDDITGEKLVIRKDDSLKIIYKRIEIYQRFTEPIIQFYKEKKNSKISCFKVDANKKIKDVQKEIINILDQFMIDNSSKNFKN